MSGHGAVHTPYDYEKLQETLPCYAKVEPYTADCHTASRSWQLCTKAQKLILPSNKVTCMLPQITAILVAGQATASLVICKL